MRQELEPKCQTLMQGRPLSKLCEYLVTKREINRFRAAIDDECLSKKDSTGFPESGSLIERTPPLFFQTLTFEDMALSELPLDGAPAEINIPGTGTKSVGGGSEYDFYHQIMPGDRVTVKSCLKEVYTKKGRSGDLIFVLVETIFEDSSGIILAKEKATYIRKP